MQTGEGASELGGLKGLMDVGWCCGWVRLSADDKTCFCPAGMQTGQWPRAEIITLAVAVNTACSLSGTMGSEGSSLT